MLKREQLTTEKVGRYSELIATAAFVVDGAEVALPYGNQPCWDLVVRYPGGAWTTVQVKTASRERQCGYPVIGTSRGGRTKGRYRIEDMDLAVIVHPETGSLWKIPSEVFCNRTTIILNEEYLWRGSIEITATPFAEGPKAIMVPRRNSRVHLANARSEIRARVPDVKPTWVSESSWEVTKRWCGGDGYKVIAKDMGVTQCAIRERILRVLHRLGLADHSLDKRIAAMQKRKFAATRSELAADLAVALEKVRVLESEKSF